MTAIQLIYTAFASQALFVVVLLWTRSRNVRANRILAIAIFVLGISALYTLYVRSGWYRAQPIWLFSIDPLPALYGPLFYLYTRQVLRNEAGSRAWVHFVPFVLYALAGLPRWAASGSAKLLVEQTATASPVLVVFDWAIEFQGLAYFIACVRLVGTYRAALEQGFSNLEKQQLRWLAWFLWTLLSLWIASMLVHATGLPLLIYVHTALTALIYCIAYLNAIRPELFQPASLPSDSAETAPPSAPLPALRYQKARLKDDQAQDIASRLRDLLERERPYLNPDFTLADLVLRLDVSPHQASQVLNERFGKSFYDYVNSLRVEEVKRRLSDPKHADEKVLSIGIDCGFSSKSALNANFKKWAGMTPSAFRKQQLEASSNVS